MAASEKGRTRGLLGFDGGFVRDEAVLAGPLGAVERVVGLEDELAGVRRVLRKPGAADREVDLDLLALERELRRLQRLQDARRDLVHALPSRFRKDDLELV